ncbi:MAG: clostripain-related cysteine peptidase [Phycisphaerales bacterium]
MMTRCLFSILCLTSLGLGAVVAQEPTPAQEPAAKVADPNEKAKDKDQVKIKDELQLLGKVFQKRLLLHYLKDDEGQRQAALKGLASQSAGAVKRLFEDDAEFKRLDYHLAEKVKNCERRLLAQLRRDKFQGVEDLLEFVTDRKFPETAAYAPLMGTVDVNFRWARRKELIGKDDFAKDLPDRLTAATLAVQGTAGHSIAELAKAVWKDKKPGELPAWWFDPASGPIVYEFAAVPASPEYPMVDLNQAGVEELLALPSVERETAEAIRKYAEKNGFQGPEELRLIPEVPRHLLDPLQTLCTAGHASKPKKWTVLVFLNAANNLEPCGIDDLNEMEKIGSSREVNVVVELARYYPTLKSPPVNGGYFRNPLAERHPVFYYGLENEPGIARYYVLQDDDEVMVHSVLKYRGPKTDAGRPESLADFGKWAIEHYPAEHYALVVWNHGAGWAGVSYDDNTEHGMDLPGLRTAMEQICAALGEGRHVDVLDFDACLMATVEVGYELKDTVDYLVASQEVEPGDGMPYDDYLKWLVMYPSAPPECLATAMVDTYVRSYAPQGSQVEGEQSSFSETKSAIRLSRMEDARAAVHRVAELLLARPALLGEVTEQLMVDVRRFGRLVDMHDFFTKLAEREKKDEELKTAVQAVIDLIGYPQDRYKLVNEVAITRRSSGSVIWGFNGWLTPPGSLAPYVHEGRYAKTPLVGPDERGNYVARIKFPPMLTDPNANKPVQVTEINYRFDDEPTKRTTKDFKNLFIATDFPADGVVLAEGHMVSNSRSHGLSIYFPSYLGFHPEYERLQFSQDSPWARLCAKFPLKTAESPEPVLLAGIDHLTRSERERLGGIVTPHEFRLEMRKLDPAAPWAEPLKALGCAFAAARDPRPYGQDWAGLIGKWSPKLIIADNTEGTPSGGQDPYGYLSSERPELPAIQGPDTRTLADYLGKGGRLLLTTPGIALQSWDMPFYRDLLGLTYGQNWDRSYKFRLPDRQEPVFEIETARKGQALRVFTGGDGVAPLCILADTGSMIGAKIERTHPDTGVSFRAVVLGFYLTDIKDTTQRQALLKEVLAFLYPEGIR